MSPDSMKCRLPTPLTHTQHVSSVLKVKKQKEAEKKEKTPKSTLLVAQFRGQPPTKAVTERDQGSDM